MNYLKLERLSARRVTIDAMLKGKFVYVYNMTLKWHSGRYLKNTKIQAQILIISYKKVQEVSHLKKLAASESQKFKRSEEYIRYEVQSMVYVSTM